MACHYPLFEKQNKKMEKIVNIMAEIKTNSLDKFLIIISTLRHC